MASTNRLCLRCLQLGISTKATTAHHVIEVDVDPDLRLDPANGAPLCRQCHGIVHASPEHKQLQQMHLLTC